MAPIVAVALQTSDGREGAIAQLGERVVRNDEVGGSIPPGSTSLRRLSLLRLGKPSRTEGCRVVAPLGEDGLADVQETLPYSAASDIAETGTLASQPSMKCLSQARSVTSCTARSSKCRWRGRAPGKSRRSWPRVVQRCIIA